MGTMGTPAIAGGASYGPVRAYSLGNLNEAIATSTMSNSYATGGDTLNQPSEISGKDLVAVEVLKSSDLTRWYQWDGSTAAPKIRALTALPNTQVTAATDLSAVTLTLRFTYAG